jgi:hypothetical protein
LGLHVPLPANSFAIKASDRPAVKECKEQANRILKTEHSNSTAWRVDLNEVFKKFVQHIFEKVAHSIGGTLAIGPRMQKTASGEMAFESYTDEPDAVISMQALTVFVDANFKSYWFNRSESGVQTEEFRDGIQKHLGYYEFSETSHSISVICYPSDQIEMESSNFSDQMNDGTDKLLVVGIPLRRSVIPDAVGRIAAEIDHLRESFQIEI